MDVLEGGGFFFVELGGEHMERVAVVVPSHRCKTEPKKITKTRESGANSLGTEATRARFLMEKLSRMSIVFGGQGYESCFLSSGEEGVVRLGQGSMLRTLSYCTTIIALPKEGWFHL